MSVANAGVLLLLFLGSASPVAAFRGAQGEDKTRPVTKVITLLKDMLAQMAKEAKEDEEINENMECWCKTNVAEKTKAISDEENRISSLTAAIEEYTGESARLATEISSLKKEIMKNQQALDQATALRVKQLAEFNEEEKDMLQSINSLKSAVISLSKHNSAMLQMSEDDQTDLVVGVQRELTHHKEQLKDILTTRQHSLLADFANAPEPFFAAEPAPAKPAGLLTKSANLARAPQGGQSAEIFGILKAMKESFETNLANSQKEEATNVKAYEELKAAKETEITAGQEQATTKSEQLGTADLKNAESKQDLEDTSKSLAADQKFLKAVQEKCAGGELEYQKRVQTRNMEVEAVTKALAFLTSDEAGDLLRRSTTPSFLQVLSGGQKRTRHAVERLLAQAAQKSGDPTLSALALRVRMDAFTKVKQTMQDMIEHLLKEKDDEIKHKDLCIDELNENTRATDDNEREKADLTAKIEERQAQLDELNKNIEQLQAEIKEAKKQLKMAGENREIANKDFNLLVADQRATQKLITASLNILKGFYEKSALLKVHARASARQPEGFKQYKKNENAGGVMGMMQGIIEDSKELEEEAVHAEQLNQEEYEVFVMDSNLLIEDKTRDLINKNEVKATTEKTKTEAEVNRNEVQDTLVTLYDDAHSIHIDCDYLLKNFDVRVVARDDEIEALRQGIAMFSGGSFSALAQHYQGPM